MARVLIVPCGCRGRELARALREDGHAVRGTTRGAGVAAIAEVGAEPYVGDPDRIGTLMDALHGVTVVCWLMGGVAIPEGRVRMFWEKIVDTGVRGVVHEGGGEAVARDGSERWRIPLEVVGADGDALAAVRRLLG